MTIKDYVPTGELAADRTYPAPRPQTLDGKVVGFLDNSKWNANKLLRGIEGRLRQRFRIQETIWHKKDSFSSPAPAETIAELAARCHVIITAIGD